MKKTRKPRLGYHQGGKNKKEITEKLCFTPEEHRKIDTWLRKHEGQRQYYRNYPK